MCSHLLHSNTVVSVLLLALECSFSLKKEGKYRNAIPKNIDKSSCEYTESYYRNARCNSSVEMKTIVRLKLEFDFTSWQKGGSDLH